MWFFFFILFGGLTLICLVPFLISVFYLVGGIKTYRLGRRENNKGMLISGMNAVFLSVAGMVLCFVIWWWLFRALLSWDL